MPASRYASGATGNASTTRWPKKASPGPTPQLQRAVRVWKVERERDGGRVFIPLVFAPGEAYQFDWSYETVELGGQVQPVKVAHLRLGHSRVFLAVAYLREAQEMVFDAHWRAFRLWGGVPRRGIYDNLKTAVDLIFVGKERQYNRRFLQMASHYLIEPVACTPAAGWEKGQVENQVGHVREQVFTPRLEMRRPGRAQRAARTSLCRDRAAHHPSGTARAHPLGGVRGGRTSSAAALAGALRWLCRARGAGQFHGIGALRPQSLQRRLPLGGQDGVGTRLCRAHRHGRRRPGSGRTPAQL